jgi:hypothetical protein
MLRDKNFAPGLNPGVCLWANGKTLSASFRKPRSGYPESIIPAQVGMDYGFAPSARPGMTGRLTASGED